VKLSATIQVEGQEPQVIHSRPVDIVQWENGTKRKITDGMGLGDVMRIIHSAAKRQGLTEQGFEDWAASLEDFDPVTPEVDPTPKDPSAD